MISPLRIISGVTCRSSHEERGLKFFVNHAIIAAAQVAPRMRSVD